MIEFIKDGKKYQITFSYPDKNSHFRRYTFSKLSCKIENPEDSNDYAWETLAEAYSKCNLMMDTYDKELGRYWAFKNLIDKVYDRAFRTILWKLYLDKYGLPPKPKLASYYFLSHYYKEIIASGKNKKINLKIKLLKDIEQ